MIDLTSNCVAQYKLNDCLGNAVVVNEFGSDGTFNGGNTEDHSVTSHHANLGKRLQFNGVDDFVDLTNTSTIKATLPLSLSFWLKVNSIGGNIISIDDHYTNPPNLYYGWWVQILVNGKLRLSYGDGGAKNTLHRRSKDSTTALQTGVDYHIACVIRGAQDMDIYINGENDGGDYSGTGGALAYSSAKSTLMAREQSPSDLVNGYIDNVCIFNKGLSQTEVSFLYNNGNGRESLRELARSLVHGSLANNKRGLV